MNNDAGWCRQRRSLEHARARHAEDRLDRDRGGRAAAVADGCSASRRRSPAITATSPCWPFPRRRPTPIRKPGSASTASRTKSGMARQADRRCRPDTRSLPADAVVAGDRIIDLSARLDKDGRLAWDVPAGKWTILRIGYTPTGMGQRAVAEGGRGARMRQAEQGGGGRPLRRPDGEAHRRRRPGRRQDARLARTSIAGKWASRTGRRKWPPSSASAAATTCKRFLPVDHRPGGRFAGSLGAVPVGPAADDRRPDYARITPAGCGNWPTGTACNCRSSPTASG